MKPLHLDAMVKGWFVGGFTPTAFATDDFEVAVKHYKAGDQEENHFHKIATELTVVVSGTVRMLGRQWSAGDIVVIEPGTATDFEALSDAVNVVVKVPSVQGDKYLTGDVRSGQAPQATGGPAAVPVARGTAPSAP